MGSNIVETIRQKYPTMTRKQKSIADFMLADPDSMAFMTLKELSEKTNVSETTILHTCTALELSNYNELKYEFRKYLNERTKTEVQQQNLYVIGAVPEYELNDKVQLLTDICHEEHNTLNLFFSQLNTNSLFQAAHMILDASSTIFCARGASLQVANFLSMRLATVGLPSIVIDTENNDSLHSKLPLFNGSTLVVPICLPDYYLMTVKACEFAHKRHCRILGITDSAKLSPIAPMCDLLLLAPSNTRMFLNTLSSSMAVANLLSSALNIEKSARRYTKSTASEEFSRLFINN